MAIIAMMGAGAGGAQHQFTVDSHNEWCQKSAFSVVSINDCEGLPGQEHYGA